MDRQPFHSTHAEISQRSICTRIGYNVIASGGLEVLHKASRRSSLPIIRSDSFSHIYESSSRQRTLQRRQSVHTGVEVSHNQYGPDRQRSDFLDNRG